jgi:hypothetical protein
MPKKKVTITLKHGSEPDSKFNAKQLKIGIKTEKEHTNNVGIAKQIVKAHLSEIPDYYTRLKKMEKTAKKSKKR